eukprot:SAG31_NODE_30246_length_383_cov_1.809859_2_plen_69_part_01
MEGCSDAVARKLPITNVKRGKRKKQGNALQVATWIRNCFGLSLCYVIFILKYIPVRLRGTACNSCVPST